MRYLTTLGVLVLLAPALARADASEQDRRACAQRMSQCKPVTPAWSAANDAVGKDIISAHPGGRDAQGQILYIDGPAVYRKCLATVEAHSCEHANITCALRNCDWRSPASCFAHCAQPKGTASTQDGKHCEVKAGTTPYILHSNHVPGCGDSTSVCYLEIHCIERWEGQVTTSDDNVACKPNPGGDSCPTADACLADQENFVEPVASHAPPAVAPVTGPGAGTRKGAGVPE
jgi:hypothetical protein